LKHLIRSSLLLLLVVVPSVASAQRMDGIAAVVNDEVVLQSDVEEQLYLYLQRAQIRPDSAGIDTLRRQVLNQLIDEKLIVAEAKRAGLSVTDAEVDREVDAALADVQQRLGGERAYQEQLARENTTEAKLREKYRGDMTRQLLAQRLLQKQLPHKTVPQAEAEAYFQANHDKFPRAPAELRLQVVQVPATPDSAALAKGLATIRAARKRITGGEKFAKVAAEVSEDPGSARSGGDLGFFGHGALDVSLEKVAFSIAPGVLSEPIRSPFGWHLLEVIERDTMKTIAGRDSADAQGAPVLEVHARHILVRVPVSDADADRAEALAGKVREEALAGTDFATLVKRYSKYEGNVDEKGDIGFIPVTALQDHIRDALVSLPVGAISEVLPNQVGYNVFKIVDRKPEHDYKLEEIRGELPDAVAQMKYRDRYEEWMKGLRSKAHIEIRNS